jgi:hypothetical protein
MSPQNAPPPGRHWPVLVAAIIAFGVLMAIRAEAASPVLRATIAGCAAAILVIGIALSGIRGKRK